MKYFLDAYRSWDRDAREADCYAPYLERLGSALKAYERRVEEITPQLLAEVVQIAEAFYVDDAIIARYFNDPHSGTIQLILRCGNSISGYFDLAITYNEAEISAEHEQVLVGIAKLPGRMQAAGQDCYCHELDVLEDGRIAHRLLFNDCESEPNLGCWFAIRCRRMTVHRIDRPNRRIPRVSDRFTEQSPVTRSSGQDKRRPRRR